MTVQSIARAYLSAHHEPNHPSYASFVHETINQYRSLISNGLKVIPVSGTLTGSSAELFARLDSDYSLAVAVDGSPMASEHPLDVIIPEFDLSANTIFRAVHDVLGHYSTKTPFESFAGELRAYQNHSAIYSQGAQSALYGETYAQLCVFYATGRFVEVQKCVILEPIL